MKLAKIGRVLLGSLYLGGGVFNLTVTTTMLALQSFARAHVDGANYL